MDGSQSQRAGAIDPVPLGPNSISPKLRHQATLEMELNDHSQAAAKTDFAPPESRSDLARASRRSNTDDVDTARPPAAASSDEEKTAERKFADPKAAEPDQKENTDGTAITPGDDDELSDEDAAALGLRGRQAIAVPMSAVLVVSAAWVIGLVAFFFVGRVSGFKSAGKQPIARDGIGELFLDPVLTPPATTQQTAAPAPEVPKPCWVSRQPRKWFTDVAKSVPFDLRPRDTTIDLGFAISDKKAAALRVDPKSGATETVFKQDAKGSIARVSPLPDGTNFFIAERGDRTMLPVGPTPFYVSFEKGMIGTAEGADKTIEELWKLEGEDPVVAEQVLSVGDSYLLTFRRGNDVYAGYFGADRKQKTPLSMVTDPTSKNENGKPRSATNGREIAIVLATKVPIKVGEKEEVLGRIHLAKGAPMATPSTPVMIDLPPNGPGGDAIAPDIVGLPDGRWLLMWTEGPSGEREIRAQTYDADFKPLGDPIALSRPGSSFGQAVLSVLGSYTTVTFLEAAESGYDMWGAVLQCSL